MRAVWHRQNGKWRTWRGLPSAERGRTAEAIALLLVAEVLVALVPLHHWRSLLDNAAAPSSAAPIAVLSAVQRAIGRAARNISTPAKCLPQALAAHWMLRRRRIGSRIHLGVIRTGEDSFAFHAWLEADRHILTGEHSATYRPIRQPRP